MKQIFSMVSAGVVGGLIAFLGLSQVTSTEVRQENNMSPRAVLTSTNSQPTILNEPFNFVSAAELVTPSVVYITAEESRALAQQRQSERKRSSPFGGGFFDMEDFFGGSDFYGPQNGSGSGVIISEDGYIVTNNHVVEFADIINIQLSDGRKLQAVKVGTDPSTDLALLKIEASGLQAAKFGDSENVKVGEWVAAIGNPFGYLQSTVTAGIVSAKGRDIDIIKGEKTIEEFIQTDAAINPGNSGGALVNVDGELIGINTAIATPTGVFAGYSFAIPSMLVMRIVDEIKENGSIQRARLGIRGETVNEALIKERNLYIDKGFYVARLEPGSAAELSGVLQGDVIYEANGKKIDTYEDLVDVMEFAKVGDTIKLDINRKNKRISIPVRLRKGI